MLEESLDDQQIIERVAALDIGKAELVCCVRLPGPGGSRRRLQEVVTYSTMTPSLQVMAERLLDLGVTQAGAVRLAPPAIRAPHQRRDPGPLGIAQDLGTRQVPNNPGRSRAYGDTP